MILSNQMLVERDVVSLAPEWVSNVAEEMSRDLIDQFLGRMEIGKGYVVRMDESTEQDPQLGRYVFHRNLDIREKRFEDVTVDQQFIVSINCNYCGMEIPVGMLDLDGDTIVRCSNCGRYHLITYEKENT